MEDFNDLDKRVLATMTGRDRIKALLAEKGLNLKDFAEKHNEWVMNVSYCLSGERPLPKIRKKLAKELGLPLETITRLIDGNPVHEGDSHDD